MPHRGQIVSDAEIQYAEREGLRGALHGAATWGIPTLLLGLTLQTFNPIYKSLTFQFKVFLQMSGMTVGACVEAERRLRSVEGVARRARKLKRDQEVWRMYEEGFERESAPAREGESGRGRGDAGGDGGGKGNEGGVK